MTTPTLTARDTALISCWARTTWRVARSHRAGTPDKPEAEGGSLTGAALAEFGPHAHYEARSGSGLTIYRAIRTGPLQFHRETLHHVSWATVNAWLKTWTTQDRATLIRLDRERFQLEHTEEDLTYNPTQTWAEAMARAGRREQRMAAGDRDRIRHLQQQLTALVDKYLTGDHSPTQQPSLF